MRNNRQAVYMAGVSSNPQNTLCDAGIHRCRGILRVIMNCSGGAVPVWRSCSDHRMDHKQLKVNNNMFSRIKGASEDDMRLLEGTVNHR